MDYRRRRCSDERARKGGEQVGISKGRALVLNTPQTEFTWPEPPVAAVSSRGCDAKGGRTRDWLECHAEMAKRPSSWERETRRNPGRIQDPG